MYIISYKNIIIGRLPNKDANDRNLFKVIGKKVEELKKENYKGKAIFEVSKANGRSRFIKTLGFININFK